MNLTKSNKRSQKRIMVILAVLVFGFALSSLVNFHLYRICGDPLNVQLAICKREDLKVDNNSTPNSAPFISLALVPETVNIQPVCLSLLGENSVSIVNPFLDFLSRDPKSLRAPPLA